MKRGQTGGRIRPQERTYQEPKTKTCLKEPACLEPDVKQRDRRAEDTSNPV